MKTTNELRRLNIVKVDGKIYQVFSVDSCFVGLSEVGKDELLFDTDVKNVDPVELTEETIEVLFNLAYIHGIYSLVGFEYDLVYIHDSFRLYDEGEGLTLGSPINFAHQLQNLYQPLTNSELEIKTTTMEIIDDTNMEERTPDAINTAFDWYVPRINMKDVTKFSKKGRTLYEKAASRMAELSNKTPVYNDVINEMVKTMINQSDHMALEMLRKMNSNK